MKKIEIINRYNSNIIISGKYESIKDCLENNRGANLRGADLRNANLRDADLRGADLRDANLIGADLIGADLINADLRGANLRGANLRGADLRGANLRGANLRNADLIDADLIGADLRNADLRNADLRNADLIGADLIDADLIGADLRNADLIDANLRNADLRDANLIGADLRNADLRNADLIGAKGLNSKHCTLMDYIKKYKIKKRGCYIFAYKGVTKDLDSPLYHNKLSYKIGKRVEVEEANQDYYTECGAGINLCPTIELAKEWGQTIIKVKVHMADVVVIPYKDNKFRVKKCEVIELVQEEKKIDL